jgi:hypothetical protein
MCDRKRTLKEDPADYAKLVRKSRFLCLECGRSARKKKHLCKPERIDSLLTIQDG